MFLVGTEANEYFVKLANADKCFLVPKARETEYVETLTNIIEQENIDFVHAQPDIEVEILSENRDRLGAKVFLPSKKTIRICQNKLETLKYLQKKDVPVAKFLEIRRTTDVEKAFDEYGCQIWIRAVHGAGGRGSSPATNKTTALNWINYWKAREKPWKFIAQQHLPGRNIAFHSLWKEGELVTSMARERIQYIYPEIAPSGITGTPAVQRTIHDNEVNKIGTDAVLAIDPNFNGIACVDLKENDQRTPCVTEINAGRMFTTSFFFSYASKIVNNNYQGNIPLLYVKLALEEKINKIPRFNTLPANLFWIRNIDAPAKLVYRNKIIGEMYHSR